MIGEERIHFKLTHILNNICNIIAAAVFLLILETTVDSQNLKLKQFLLKLWHSRPQGAFSVLSICCLILSNWHISNGIIQLLYQMIGVCCAQFLLYIDMYTYRWEYVFPKVYLLPQSIGQ